MKSTIAILLIVLVLILGGCAWQFYRFDLCMEVFDNFWYCFREFSN